MYCGWLKQDSSSMRDFMRHHSRVSQTAAVAEDRVLSRGFVPIMTMFSCLFQVPCCQRRCIVLRPQDCSEQHAGQAAETC